MTLAPREESTEGWEPEQILILCWLQTEVQAVSNVLLLHNEHNYPSLCSDEGLDQAPFVPHGWPHLPALTSFSLLWSCTAGQEGTAWTLCVYLSMSCGGPAAIRVLRCIWYSAWKEFKKKKKRKATAAQRLALNQVTFVFHGHRSSAEMQCGINRVEVFTQLRLRHAPRQ